MLVADNVVKRHTVSGAFLDAARDRFVLVRNTVSCGAATSAMEVGTAVVDAALSSSTALVLQVRVAAAVGSTAGNTALQLCLRHSVVATNPAYPHFTFDSATGNALAIGLDHPWCRVCACMCD